MRLYIALRSISKLNPKMIFFYTLRSWRMEWDRDLSKAQMRFLNFDIITRTPHKSSSTIHNLYEMNRIKEKIIIIGKNVKYLHFVALVFCRSSIILWRFFFHALYFYIKTGSWKTSMCVIFYVLVCNLYLFIT